MTPLFLFVLPRLTDIARPTGLVRFVSKGDVGVFRPEDCARSRHSVWTPLLAAG
jgi:hypothetical protein